MDRLNQIKEDIRIKLDILTVVERYVTLKQVGSGYKGLCPFHKEKSPSFHVSPEKGIFHCFGCGKGGDIFTFVMEIEGLSFMEALKLTAQEVGVSVDLSRNENRKIQYNSSGREVLINANGHALNYFYNEMKKSQECISYFKSREISATTVRDFKIGYAPNSWNGLLDHLKKIGFTEKNLVDAGLVISSDGGKCYDRFRGRVIFPILDVSGRVIAFGGRVIDTEGQPKYLNSPETKIYQKNRVFYGIHTARESIREYKSVIVVEGYIDVVSLYQRGIKNVVATCGTAMTIEHGQVLNRICQTVYLVFDGDSAGVNAAKRGVENLISSNLDIRVVILPSGEDPDTIVKKEGKEKFEQLLKKGQTGMEFYFENLSTQYDISTPQGKSMFVKNIGKLLSKVNDEIVLEEYVSDLSSKIGIEPSLLKNVIKGEYREEQFVEPNNEEQYLEKLLLSEEGSLIHLLVSYPEELHKWKNKISLEIFSEPMFRKLYSFIIKEDMDFTSIIDYIEDARLRNLFSLMLITKSRDSVDSINHKVEKLQKTLLSRKLQMITEELAATTDFEQKKHLLEELTSLRKAQNWEN